MKVRFPAWLPAVFAVFLLAGVPRAAAEDCHSMTEEWFGETAALLSADPDSPGAAVSAYFSAREGGFPGTASLLSADDLALSDTVLRQESYREAGIRNYQDRTGIVITDAEVTTILHPASTVDTAAGSAVLYAYEWTFYDYDDLSDGPGGSDTAGFGTRHKLTLSHTDEGWEIVADEYDEADLFGVNTISAESYAEAAAEGIDWERDAAERGDLPANPAETNLPAETAALLGLDSFQPGYDPLKAVEYSNQWVKKEGAKVYSDSSYYNPNYYSYADVGGDCANFTSQAIYAGGMEQVPCSPFGTTGWYYVSANNRSATWTGARYLRQWMANNRGVEFDATDDTVLTGNPVFYKNTSHAVLCVGKNSAGKPIINSHTADRYHVTYTYYGTNIMHTVHLYEAEGFDYSLKVTGETKPEGILSPGASFSLRGVITSAHTLTDISARVYDSQNKAVIEYHTNPRTTSYDIRYDGINDEFVFNSLPRGGYTYVVSASDASGETRELIRSVFSVGYLPAAPKKPSVVTDADTVTVSWNAVDNAAFYEEFLAQKPETIDSWEDVRYSGTTTETSYVFENIPDGDYAAFVIARPNEDTVRSDVSDVFSVTVYRNAAHLQLYGWLDGNRTYPFSLGSYGAVDVYINDELDAARTAAYDRIWVEGSTFAFRNITPAAGYSYDGKLTGNLSGVMGSYTTTLQLEFSTVNPDSFTETPAVHTYNGRSYLYFTTPATWYAAALVCDERGGRLAVPANEAENSFLASLTGGASVWLGGTDRDAEGVWKTVSGDALTWFHWADGQNDNAPNTDEGAQNFLSMGDDGQWYDEAGCTKRGFLCELDAAPAAAVSSVTLERNADGSTLATVAVNNAEAGSLLWCAVYDDGGRMLASDSLAVTAETVYSFPFAENAGVYAKAFLLDTDYRPLAVERSPA